MSTSWRCAGLFSQCIALAVALVAAGVPAADAGDADRGAANIWRDMKWPLSFDPWPPGRAFQCSKADCGADVELYVRPKLGFCNCTVGITDDSEIDQVGDLAAIGPNFAPTNASHSIVVGDMKGLARHYRIISPAGDIQALAIVTSKKCDVVVVTIASATALPVEVEQAALALLNSERVLPWITASVGIPP